MPKIYTGTGDGGETGLFGGGRVPKDHARVEAYGTVDELNSVLGVALAEGLHAKLRGMLSRVQNDLFHLGSDLCVLEEDKNRFKIPRIEPRHITQLEAFIDDLQKSLKPLDNFILPGGGPGAAQLHVARCVCRRAERSVLALLRREPVGEHVVTYLNRLSDLLFVMARYENLKSGAKDVLWNSRA